MSTADMAALRQTAEDPRARPSERMAARAALREAGEIERRNCVDCHQRFAPDFRGSWRCRACRAALVADIEADGARPGA